ncbi:hypothetical protein MsAc7_15290 [Methanolapillus millepedarum]|uniref:Uncharacterized protein n=1 Tax=Methanolapillus millepedarum TaxID=3028296 RepID=A0AA96ZWG8_9EURY|nr:hypothetical protein MsAc7_15290 [Methanosarcinaceae archaeon Ac7]
MEHKHYEKNQFSEYTRLYGSGLVVYWFGFLAEILEDQSDGYLIVDASLFKEELGARVEYLLNFAIHW